MPRTSLPSTMTGFPTANFSDSDQGLFTPDEIQALMRIEFERAQRYRYPITLMLVEIDRLADLHHLYGYDSKEEVLQAVVGLLRSVTRASDFLGCMVDDHIMAVFPHTPEVAGKALAGRLLQGSRKLKFQSDGRRLQATLSIGLAVSFPGDSQSFEDFVRGAEDGLRFAVESGGDRFVHREGALDMIRRLRSDLEDESAALVRERAAREGSLAPQPDAPTLEEQPARPPIVDGPAETPTPVVISPRKPAEVEDLGEDGMGGTLVALFDELGELTPELESLRDRAAGMAREALREARDRVAAEHADKMDLLERRITKLKETLEQTESELLQIARMKGVDTGVASIYKTVQGLADGAQGFEKKKEMLTMVFEANVALQKKIT